MVVGVVVWNLHLVASHSLKDKRRVLRSLKDRLHQKFNVSVAEIGGQDLWQRAELACCVVSGSRDQVQRVLQAADRLVDAHPEARIIDSHTTYC